MVFCGRPGLRDAGPVFDNPESRMYPHLEALDSVREMSYDGYMKTVHHTIPCHLQRQQQQQQRMGRGRAFAQDGTV